MKKLISVLLAILMIFSVSTVAFAEEAKEDAAESGTSAVAGDEETEDKELTLEDLYSYAEALKPASKGLKLIVKIVVKVAAIAVRLRIVSVEQIIDFIQGLVGGNGENVDTNTDVVTPALA